MLVILLLFEKAIGNIFFEIGRGAVFLNRSLKIIMNVLNICLVFCYICIILYVFVAAPSLFGYTPQIVLSPSMEPGYKVGSVIYYDDSVPFESIEMFDVITFKLGRKDTATHRVVGVNMTQGKQILLLPVYIPVLAVHHLIYLR